MKQYSKKKRKIADLFRSLFIISSSAIRLLYPCCPLSEKNGFIPEQFIACVIFSDSISLLIVSKSISRRSVFQNFISQSCAIHYCLWNLFIYKGTFIWPYMFWLFRRTFIKRSKVYLESSRMSTMELFCEKTPSQIFDWVLNTPVLTQTSK